MSDNPAPVSTIHVPVEAVQLCISNAERLLNDAAADVSTPTSAALIELALEETLKGWILFLNLDDAPRWPKKLDEQSPKPSEGTGRPTYDPKIEAEIQSKLRRIPRGEDLRRVFLGRDAHRIKLDTLDLLITVFSNFQVTPEVLKEALIKGFKLNMGEAFDSSGAVGEVTEEAIDQYKQSIKLVNTEKVHELSRWKELGFYVNLNGGSFASPDSFTFPNLEVFEEYVDHLNGLLRSTLAATTRVNAFEPRTRSEGQ